MMNKLNRYERLEQEGAYLTADTAVEGAEGFLKPILEQAAAKTPQAGNYSAVRLINGLDENIIGTVNAAFGPVYRENADGYVIVAADDIRIYAASQRGLMYGVYSLLQQSENGFFRKGIIYNDPLCSFRGLKIYLPGEEDVEYFKAFIDMACYYRYNKIVLEVGGAMEFKRHPEINEGWQQFCDEMREYSGKGKDIQNGFTWEKNSIHCENGGGGWLKQETVKELVQYCTERGLDVIPEVPSLSHCDYLLTRHPELAERQDDPYPDTYCPSNPASYELLFDVLDEIIDVFRPETVHVGHDELYTIAVCDACRGKDAAQLYTDDLVKISRYLTERDIRTMIWGEKLLDSGGSSSHAFAGARRIIVNEAGYVEQVIPATFAAIDMIPKDIEIMHWYWFFGKQFDEQLLDRNLYTVYGNFEGPGIPGWGPRLAKGIQGAAISNWSALKESYLQRNGIFFNMAYGCRMFWQDHYEESMYPKLAEEVFEELFQYKNKAILAGPHIEITHASSQYREFQWFFDGRFIDSDHDLLGEYELTFEGGEKVIVPVNYGTDLSALDCSWGLKPGNRFDAYDFDRTLIQVSGSVLPVRDGRHTWFKMVLPHPYPGKTLTGAAFKARNETSGSVVLRSISLKNGE
ncbi:beta-N-acetylhexosaminidase [Paenibacillus pasadenensis]|uniref:family 20 glycosylhydrolase n=1 Tax=Paenibacillus pasadenensis TaxID=217090 RepID=UPI00203C4EA1|nr:family 20 glycosylhydrolase [Paenibacillus pasadenensis]MCM3745737.1 beta-N-acetylhexosaminidase [Paenibacillus pasadenensis]